jgi:hypothetical protein
MYIGNTYNIKCNVDLCSPARGPTPTQRDAVPWQRAALSFRSAPIDEGNWREARPASVHRLVSQVPEQCQGRGPKAPEGLE